MPDDPALVRQWRLIKILSGKRLGAGVRELAAELHVGEKTIRRDLQTLLDVGFPLEQCSGQHGRKTWSMQGGNCHRRKTAGVLAVFQLSSVVPHKRRYLFWFAGFHPFEEDEIHASRAEN